MIIVCNGRDRAFEKKLGNGILKNLCSKVFLRQFLRFVEKIDDYDNFGINQIRFSPFLSIKYEIKRKIFSGDFAILEINSAKKSDYVLSKFNYFN